MKTVGDKQKRFAADIAQLILRMCAAGYQVSVGEFKRSDEQSHINAIGQEGREILARFCDSIGWKGMAEALRNNGRANGIVNSAHQLQIAADLNLFKGGVYLDKTEDHRQFGEWWESLSPLHRWGGRFKDGNHYSIEHNGVK